MSREMPAELKELIATVMASDEPVKTVVENYFAATTWSLLADEWRNHMNADERRKFVKKLELLRHLEKEKQK